jgi:hypothetical protein
MQLDLTDEETAVLINLLTGIFEADQYPMSRRLQLLRASSAMVNRLPTAKIQPAR